jgi:hypothetical protein
MRCKVQSGVERFGGGIGYPSDRLLEEVAYIAFHFHWSHEQILGLEHKERQIWVEEIAKINRRLNEEMNAEMEKYAR